MNQGDLLGSSDQATCCERCREGELESDPDLHHPTGFLEGEPWVHSLIPDSHQQDKSRRMTIGIAPSLRQGLGRCKP